MAGPPHPHAYMGWWGSIGSPKQKYITSYSISPFAAKPFKDAGYNAIFNTFRRTKNQFLYVAIPFAVIWSIWARARDYNEYLYTKEGREELARVNV
ncbi:unnamed protein product [Candida verbasci]|uniref:Cytochrome b-c1 complex subunit 8 n=1 Tax=Candida verbasci TaxID=1227364 RepID=A0A9W4TWF7_9ASCO|nr:unnamed protein product [Candida verbasci]